MAVDFTLQLHRIPWLGKSEFSKAGYYSPPQHEASFPPNPVVPEYGRKSRIGTVQKL